VTHSIRGGGNEQEKVPERDHPRTGNPGCVTGTPETWRGRTKRVASRRLRMARTPPKGNRIHYPLVPVPKLRDESWRAHQGLANLPAWFASSGLPTALGNGRNDGTQEPIYGFRRVKDLGDIRLQHDGHDLALQARCKSVGSRLRVVEFVFSAHIVVWPTVSLCFPHNLFVHASLQHAR